MTSRTIRSAPALRKRKPPPPERTPTTTTYAVLGMLTLDEMSGYSLCKLIEQSIAHFGFQPAKSQVYAALRRLVGLGWATKREVAQQDRPDKRLYRITTAGEEALKKWLERPEVEPEIVRSPFLLKVFFGALVPPETLMAQVEEAHRRAVEELEALEEVEREIEHLDRPGLRFPALVLRYGLAHNRASVAWTVEMLRELGAAPPQAPDDPEPSFDQAAGQAGAGKGD